jgi:hypothetical protein
MRAGDESESESIMARRGGCAGGGVGAAVRFGKGGDGDRGSVGDGGDGVGGERGVGGDSGMVGTVLDWLRVSSALATDGFLPASAVTWRSERLFLATRWT